MNKKSEMVFIVFKVFGMSVLASGVALAQPHRQMQIYANQKGQRRQG